MEGSLRMTSNFWVFCVILRSEATKNPYSLCGGDGWFDYAQGQNDRGGLYICLHFNYKKWILRRKYVVALSTGVWYNEEKTRRFTS